jgi:cytochrome c-type biogenesis protein CcmH/NrfF
MIFGILCTALTWQGMQGVNDYNQRFNYLTKRVRCQNCPNTSISDSDAKIASAVRDDIALMLRMEMSNSQILDSLQKQRMPIYDPGIQIKLYLAVLSISLLLAIIFFAIKYLY